MISSLDASSERFMESLREINRRVERSQREVSTGKRLSQPSDDPDTVGILLQVRADLARLEQTQSNLSRIRTEVDAAESAMQNAVTLFDRVRTLGMTAASGTQTALTRAGIAGELAAIEERLIGLANTEVDGRYIFSGDSDQGPAYRIDFQAQTPPWGAYLGTAATRLALHPTGVSFAIARDAQAIFDNPADAAKSALQTIETLRQALLANDDKAIEDALEPLAGVSAHLNAQLTFYGNAQSQVWEAFDTGSKLKLRLASEQAEYEDADMTAAILELQQAKFQQEAAYQVRAAAPRKSLFDYMG